MTTTTVSGIHNHLRKILLDRMLVIVSFVGEGGTVTLNTSSRRFTRACGSKCRIAMCQTLTLKYWKLLITSNGSQAGKRDSDFETTYGQLEKSIVQ